MKRICKDAGHRQYLRKTGEECTCPKYVPAKQYDALAAHVELLCQRWSEFLDSGDERDGAAFRMQESVESSPATSLAHLKAKWQADFIRGLLNNHDEFSHPDVGPIVELLLKLETVLRRQAEKPT